MDRLFDWSARPAERMVTVGSLRAGKGTPARHAQITADTTEEAAAAEIAGIEMVVCRATNIGAVRQGSTKVFVTAALGFTEAISEDEVLRSAIKALTDGADAVLTTRRLSVVSYLASEDIPVMGHLGFVPRKSTWVGKTRSVGKTADEALALWHRFRRLEEAGAFAVEAELVAAPLLTEITARSGLVTVSLGSGPGGDVVFLFGSDISGDVGRLPRHSKRYGDVGSLRRQIDEERQRAFAAFRADVQSGGFPGPGHSADMQPDELRQFFSRLSENEK